MFWLIKSPIIYPTQIFNPQIVPDSKIYFSSLSRRCSFFGRIFRKNLIHSHMNMSVHLCVRQLYIWPYNLIQCHYTLVARNKAPSKRCETTSWQWCLKSYLIKASSSGNNYTILNCAASFLEKVIYQWNKLFWVLIWRNYIFYIFSRSLHKTW